MSETEQAVKKLQEIKQAVLDRALRIEESLRRIKELSPEW